MALDDVVKTTTTGPRIEEAMYRTLRWIERCVKGLHSSKTASFAPWIVFLISYLVDFWLEHAFLPLP